MHLIRDWFDRHFSNPQVVILTGLLAAITIVSVLFGRMLAPVIAAIIIAYLLVGPVKRMQALGVPRLTAVWVAFLGFIAVLLFSVLWVLPLLIRQVTQLVQQMPSMVTQAQNVLVRLPEEYPGIISPDQIHQLMTSLRGGLLEISQYLLSYSVSSLVAVITLAVYLILVPFLVFFFLKDAGRIIGWLVSFLPRDRHLTRVVWNEVSEQMGNYVQGKAIEMLIVGIVTYVVFTILGLNFSLLLAVLTGLSVLIPYVGAVAVTVPLAMIAYFQWGWEPELAYAIVAYAVIQAIDGNLLAPLLLSEAVNLHPVAIIVAVLFFGGLWGFWGVFFAIPLATVVQAVIRAWPKAPRDEAEAPRDAAE